MHAAVRGRVYVCVCAPPRCAHTTTTITTATATATTITTATAAAATTHVTG
jgi:hypothetical protein